MSEYQICARCIMDTSDPEITFDDRGFCNHCIGAEKKLKNGCFSGELGREKLDAISCEIREYGEKKEYDCIIGVSGGVDSSYLLHVATKVMKLRPLVVHVDAGWNSEIAVKNIESLVKPLNLDLFTYVVDWEEIRDLQLAYLRSSVANQDTPQDHTFFAKLYEFAIKNNIKYVVTGSNHTSESILPPAWGYNAMDKKQLLAIHRRFGTRPLKTYPMISFFNYKIYWPYVKKMTRVNPLNFISYDKNKAIEFLQENYGWRYYGGKHHESKWTKYFQAYYLPQKFGFDKRKAHLSSMIVAGQITREEALAEMDCPLYKPDELHRDRDYIAKKLCISLEELSELECLPNKTYKDYPNQEALLKLMQSIKNRFATGEGR